jgi:hypothetical protein
MLDATEQGIPRTSASGVRPIHSRTVARTPDSDRVLVPGSKAGEVVIAVRQSWKEDLQ